MHDREYRAPELRHRKNGCSQWNYFQGDPQLYGRDWLNAPRMTSLRGLDRRTQGETRRWRRNWQSLGRCIQFEELESSARRSGRSRSNGALPSNQNGRVWPNDRPVLPAENRPNPNVAAIRRSMAASAMKVFRSVILIAGRPSFRGLCRRLVNARLLVCQADNQPEVPHLQKQCCRDGPTACKPHRSGGSENPRRHSDEDRDHPRQKLRKIHLLHIPQRKSTSYFIILENTQVSSPPP